MHLILDIDHTLLNTTRFKKALATCAGDLGVTPRLFWNAYRELRKKGAFDAATFLNYPPPLHSAAVLFLKKDLMES